MPGQPPLNLRKPPLMTAFRVHACNGPNPRPAVLLIAMVARLSDRCDFVVFPIERDCEIPITHTLANIASIG